MIDMAGLPGQRAAQLVWHEVVGNRFPQLQAGKALWKRAARDLLPKRLYWQAYRLASRMVGR